MKKLNLKALAALAIAGGTIVAANVESAFFSSSKNKEPSPYHYQFNSIRTQEQEVLQNKNVISESELLQQLDKEGRALYQGLDQEGKKLARELASGYPRGEDKREAVEIAVKHTAEQRVKVQNKMLQRGMDRISTKPREDDQPSS